MAGAVAELADVEDDTDVPDIEGEAAALGTGAAVLPAEVGVVGLVEPATVCHTRRRATTVPVTVKSLRGECSGHRTQGATTSHSTPRATPARTQLALPRRSGCRWE